MIDGNQDKIKDSIFMSRVTQFFFLLFQLNEVRADVVDDSRRPWQSHD